MKTVAEILGNAALFLLFSEPDEAKRFAQRAIAIAPESEE